MSHHNGEIDYMNILVTGGLGTVGAGLVKETRQRGHHVVSCDQYRQPDEVYGDWPNLMVETVMNEYEIKQMNDYRHDEVGE